jgi:hypothetical protein
VQLCIAACRLAAVGNCPPAINTRFERISPPSPGLLLRWHSSWSWFQLGTPVQREAALCNRPPLTNSPFGHISTPSPPPPRAPCKTGGTTADLGVQLGTPTTQGSILANGAPAMDSRFVRAAKTVAECLGLVKTLSERVNSATAFRECCSKLLGGAFAASLALQEVCAGWGQGRHCLPRQRQIPIIRPVACSKECAACARFMIEFMSSNVVNGFRSPVCFSRCACPSELS